MNRDKRYAGNRKIGVFIADSYPVFQHGLESYFAATPDLVMAGKAGTGQEMMEGGQWTRVNALLLDAGLAGLDGFMVLKQFKDDNPDIPVLLMAASQDFRWLLKGIRAGASGVVSREASLEEMEMAIRRVYAGQTYIPAPLAEKLVLHYQRNEEEPLEERLSPREYEVMQWLTRGLKLSEIARQLEVSHQTVTTHRRHILKKTGLRTTAEIIRCGLLNGMGEPIEKV